MLRITRHFTLDELLLSRKAKELGIDNTQPPVSAIVNLTALVVEVLQPLRDYLSAPVIITSGYRCNSLNQAVGGVKNSQHLTGQAADITFYNSIDMERKALRYIREHLHFDQLIWEKRGNTRWIHVSFDTLHNRNQFINKTNLLY